MEPMSTAHPSPAGRFRSPSAAEHAACGFDAFQFLASAEKLLGIRLPAAYRRYLHALAGGSVREPLPGLLLAGGRLLASRETAVHLLKDSRSAYALARRDFVFVLDQRYRFYFFRCGEGADPPVYRFVEGERGPRRMGDSLGEWLRQVPAAA